MVGNQLHDLYLYFHIRRGSHHVTYSSTYVVDPTDPNLGSRWRMIDTLQLFYKLDTNGIKEVYDSPSFIIMDGVSRQNI